MNKKMTVWQSFEMANKYYLVVMGTFWVTIGLVTLILFMMGYTYAWWGGAFIWIIIGIIALIIGVISKVSKKK
ncbi:hypothetical protein FP804_02125 [archaeon]|nr:hypothetical protein [archaeon]